MTATAPLDVETQQQSIAIDDDLTIVDSPVLLETVSAQPPVHRDPAMAFVYLGLLSLIAIVAVAAMLAL